MYSMMDLSSLSLRQAVNAIVNRSRGLCWYIYTDLDANAWLVVRSMIDESIEISGVTIPGHALDDRKNLDLWRQQENTRVSLTLDQSQRYDRITVRGAPIRVCGTWNAVRDDIVKGWPFAVEQAYEDAAKNTDGYAELDEKAKAELNDKFRSEDKFADVFTKFIVPNTWDWTLGGYNANPKWIPTLEPAPHIEPAQNAPYWNANKRFHDMLPFKEGVDYSQDPPVDNNPAGTIAEYRKPFAICDQGGGGVYADKMKVPAQVRSLPNQLGFEVKTNPQYLMARDNFSLAEPGLWDSDLDTHGTNWQWMTITAMISTDQRFEVTDTLTGATAENPRTLIIEVDDAEYWWIVPGTYVGVDADGAPVEYNGNSTFRDDTQRLIDVLMAAKAWYGRKRLKVEIRNDVLQPQARIAQMLEHVDITTDHDAPGSVVTSIKTDYRSSRVHYRTDHVELDFENILQLGGRSGSTHLPNLKVTARRINDIDKRLAATKADIDKRPVRQSPPPPPPAGAPVRRAKVTEAAGTGATITANLYDLEGNEITTGTGSGITVNCSLIGGTDLSDVSPTLEAGSIIFVAQLKNDTGDATWYCVDLFGEGGGGGDTTTWAEVTTQLDYTTPQTALGVKLLDSSGTAQDPEITIDKVTNEPGTVQDLRNWMPWFVVGQAVELVKPSGESDWHIPALMYVGNSSPRTIACVDETDGKIGVVWPMV
ncbi:hypothetical protein [Anaerohalosphaera lusitana]|nr:hypothetical protein [Anaerohalosphaera lusitana]